MQGMSGGGNSAATHASAGLPLQLTVLKMSWLLVANHRLLPAHAAACTSRGGQQSGARWVLRAGRTRCRRWCRQCRRQAPTRPAPHLHRRGAAGRLLVRQLGRVAQQAHCRAPHTACRLNPFRSWLAPGRRGARDPSGRPARVWEAPPGLLG